MPIKLPKGFQRRKSSGHALDEVYNPPGESSFKVLERPASKGKTFDGGMHLRMVSTGPMPPPKDQSGQEEMFPAGRLDASNRGSGGTERSLSNAPYDSAGSSTRLSTSSTNPSSIDTKSDKNISGPGLRAINDVPLQPPNPSKPSFLRSPARTFSYGAIKDSRGSPTSPGNTLPPLVSNQRNRTVTESTASTATPPRLFDSDLALDNSELDGFGNMFDHIGSSPDPAPSRLIHQEIVSSSPITSYPPTAYPGTGAIRVSRAPPPLPIQTDRSQFVESSPYSWNSQTSHDGLMRSPSPSRTVTQGSPLRNKEPDLHTGGNGSVNAGSGTIPPRRPVVPRKPTHEESLQPAPLSPTKSREAKPLAASPTKDMTALSPASTYSATFDPDMAEHAQLANIYQEKKEAVPKPISTNKVMTPAQWERYKQQKEMDRRLGALSDDSSSEASDHSDDDDELERGRQAAKQRQKQEAHLAVYRQKMMKVTGETGPARSGSGLGVLRPGDTSPGDLNNRMSQMTFDSKNSGRSSVEEEEEDEDVPLGILAAHGFPNRNRPPTRLGNSASNPNLRAVHQSQAAPSVKGGALPVFARQLPQDPYYGASLVQPSNREAPSLHPNAVPQGAGPSTAHPVHPSGLVGVIAGEERARAARRGSPNASGNYEMPQMPPHPGMVRSQTAGTFSTMGYPTGMPGMPPMLTPGDQAQMQMAQQMNQMNQMMQMQMQWMQQMSQNYGGGMNPSQLNMPQFHNPQDPMASRPQSMHMQEPAGHRVGQRTMSTLNPTMAPWNSSQSILPSINVNGNYAPSLAPSERSNVGLAPRYRPVSTVPEPDRASHHRASTFTATSARPWTSMDPNPRPPQHGIKPSINTLGRRSPLANQDDEDDDEGWAEMKMKKDKKQKTWALRKGQNALQELYNSAS